MNLGTTERMEIIKDELESNGVPNPFYQSELLHQG